MERTKAEAISQSELTELKADLERARAKGDLQQVVGILKVLQRRQMTRELLAATLVGKTLSGLVNLNLKEPKPEIEAEASSIRDLASAIVADWKQVSR